MKRGVGRVGASRRYLVLRRRRAVVQARRRRRCRCSWAACRGIGAGAPFSWLSACGWAVVRAGLVDFFSASCFSPFESVALEAFCRVEGFTPSLSCFVFTPAAAGAGAGAGLSGVAWHGMAQQPNEPGYALKRNEMKCRLQPGALSHLDAICTHHGLFSANGRTTHTHLPTSRQIPYPLPPQSACQTMAHRRLLASPIP